MILKDDEKIQKKFVFFFLFLGIPSLSHFPFVIISWKHWQKEHRLNDKKSRHSRILSRIPWKNEIQQIVEVLKKLQ